MKGEHTPENERLQNIHSGAVGLMILGIILISIGFTLGFLWAWGEISPFVFAGVTTLGFILTFLGKVVAVWARYRLEEIKRTIPLTGKISPTSEIKIEWEEEPKKQEKSE